MESSGLSIREMKGLKGLEDPNGLKCLAEEDSEYMDQVTREVTVGWQTRTKLTGVATRTRQVSSYRDDAHGSDTFLSLKFRTINKPLFLRSVGKKGNGE